jgi:hypothetical protein
VKLLEGLIDGTLGRRLQTEKNVVNPENWKSLLLTVIAILGFEVAS